MLRNWDDLKVLLALQRHRTMTAAAKSLEMNTGTVSRRLERITEEVGKTLFVRRGYDWEATDTAVPLIRAAERMDESVVDQHRGLNAHVGGVRRLRMSINLQIMCDVFSRNIGRFLAEYPDICIDVFNEEMSVALGQVDLQLSFSEPSSGRLVRSQVGTVGYFSYVHETWSTNPKGYIELANDEGRQTPCSTFMEEMFEEPRFTTSCLSEAVDLLNDMPLVVCLPTRFARRQPGLRPWKPGFPINEFPVWAVYHESRRLDPDIRLALDFVRSCFD